MSALAPSLLFADELDHEGHETRGDEDAQKFHDSLLIYLDGKEISAQTVKRIAKETYRGRQL